MYMIILHIVCPVVMEIQIQVTWPGMFWKQRVEYEAFE